MRGLLAIALAAAAGGLLYMETKQAVPLSAKLAFLDHFGPIALEVARENGWGIVVATILIAWSAMESAWGTSDLAAKAAPDGGLNVFGVKAGDTWKGLGRPYVTMTTKEHQGTPQEETIRATFRSYGSWEESARDLVHLLKIETAYKPIVAAFDRGDVVGFFQAVDASAYSTAANYATRIQDALDDVARVA